MSVRLLVGDALTRLRELPDASVSMCCTSPPYYGLRSYSTSPQVWGGDPACSHAWQDGSYKRTQPTVSANTTLGGAMPATERERGGGLVSGAYCTRCTAWRGELGSEPTPEQYVANLVAVFREVRRVLHPSGICVINLGDSMSNSGKGPSGKNGLGSRGVRQETRQGFVGGARRNGTSRTAPASSRGGDCPWTSLCGECVGALLLAHTARSDSRPAPESTACAGDPSPERTESLDPLPDSEDSANPSPSEQSCLSTPGQQPSAAHAGVQPLASPGSTTAESSPQPRGACSHCGNCGACLSGIHVSSGDSRPSTLGRAESLETRYGIQDSASLVALLERHNRCTPTACAASEPPDIQDNYTSLPPKNLLMMPFRIAIALQADGWILRSVMPWVKKSSMPESVTDRPSNALEWLFLFSKARTYFWDAESIRQTAQYGYCSDFRSNRYINNHAQNNHDGEYQTKTIARGDGTGGRAFRNTDPWFLSLDAAIADARADLARLEAMRATGGVLTDDEGLPIAVDVNPAAYKEAHFATYPPALVVPFVKAGTSERGCCPRCLAPWTRVVERKQYGTWNDHQSDGVVGQRQDGNAFKGANYYANYQPPKQLGWQPSCACAAGEPRPAVVLDCFAGSGTTLLVADRLGRAAIGIELSEAYAQLARERLAGDAPLWVDMAEVETAAGDYAPPGLFEWAAS